MFLLNGCIESLAFLGSTAGGAANGKLLQTSLNSVASYGIKKQTGKTPLEHALSYAKENNPDKKKERCISSIEKTNSEICMIVKKKIKETKANVAKKISAAQTNVVKKASTTQIIIKKNTQAVLDRTVDTNNLIKLKNSSKEFVLAIQDKIMKYDARWLENKK
tara:strand:+ start:785 stop:1273 length:489 start_codon:yes stop_codon:yes gene_type:complete